MVDNRVANLEHAINNLGERVEQLIGDHVSVKKHAPPEPSALTSRANRKVEMSDPAHLGSTLSGAVAQVATMMTTPTGALDLGRCIPP